MDLSPHPNARCVICLLGALALGQASTAFATSRLTDASDFGQIAKNGFALTVNGAFYTDAAKTQFPNLQPNLGSDKNSYSWSMAWFQDALWVGTNRDVLNPDPLQKGAAEIWRYTPSSFDSAGDWGLSGTWTRAFVSPGVGRAAALLSQGYLSYDTPRDLGYRNMSVCNAGDNTQRLYVTSFGLPGNILYYDGSTFRPTNATGLFNTPQGGVLANLRNPQSLLQIDLGYRGLACFKGRLWTSPAGSLQDVDASLHPVLHMNPDPGNGAPWQTVLDVGDPASNPLADPGNVGIFQIEALGRYLWLTTINRTTGMELWRGDGDDCLEPWVGDGHCNIKWAKIIDNGGGRPPDLPLITPAIDNAGATLGIFGNDLYLGVAESGFYGATLAELFRVPNAGSVPPGGPDAPHKWQLIVGWPRRDFADPGKRLPGLENLDCTNVGDVPNSKAELSPLTQLVWSTISQTIEQYTGVAGLDPVGLDDDPDDDDCLPASGAGPGFPTGILMDPMSVGNESYFWRFAQHQGELFIGTLDISSGTGLDLLKTADGTHLGVVFDNGLGNPYNYGGRSLVSTPIGLAVGTANPYTGYVDANGVPVGGTEVYIGTTAPAADAPPKANAGADQIVFDTAQSGSVQFTLQGGGTDTFGGGGLAASPYQWFQGAVAGNCANLNPADAIANTANPTLNRPSTAGPNDLVPYTFTLRVTDSDGHVGCDQVTVTASHNLPPSVNPWYSDTNPMVLSVPATYVGFGALPTVDLIDSEGAGSVAYDVTAVCSDPERALVTCKFQTVTAPGGTLSNIHDSTTDVSCGGKATCQINAHLSVPDWTALWAAGAFSTAGRPTLQVLAVDNRGFQANQQWDSLAQPIINNPVSDTNPTGNDKPVCRNADVRMIIGLDSSVTFNPATFSPPICVDPDGDPMTYTPVTAGPFPSYGNLRFGSTTITYTPTDPNTPRVDYFTFKATDPGGLSTSNFLSRDPIVRITLTEDTGKPSLAVSFPASGISYTAASFADGCSTPGLGDVCGTAGDDLSGVQSVQVAIRDASGKFWNGSTFVDNAGTPLWHPATLGTADSWSFPFTPPADGSYTLLAKSTDRVGNQSAVTTTAFGQQADNVAPTVTITFPAGGASYRSATYNSGCGTAMADICGSASDNASGVGSVQVSIIRASDGTWWNGTAFVAGGQIWLPASGTASWSYPFSPTVGTYAIQARATDGSGNVGVTAAQGFTRRRF